MTVQELTDRLQAGEVVVLETETWSALATSFDEVEAHDTHFYGSIRVMRGDSPGFMVAEEPKATERVVRLLGDEGAVAQFVADRMRTYDRMWDGCGCKVDFYA
jgi:hypothetical protein